MSDNPHQACPFVDCGSSDAFNWNDDGFGFCHSCGESYPSRKRIESFDWVSREYPVKKRINVMEIPVKGMTFDDIRGIKPSVCQFYNIQVQTGEAGQPIRYVWV